MVIQQQIVQRLKWFNIMVGIVIMILTLSVMLAGCGTTPTSDKAELLLCGIDAKPTVVTEEMATLDLHPWHSRESLLRTLNGKPFCPQESEPCSSRKILIPPGQHEVIVSYKKSYSVLGPGGRDPVKFRLTAQAGERYRVIVKQTGIIGWKYLCKIEEASSGRTIVEIEDCDRDEIRRPAMNDVYDAFGGKQKYRDRKCYHR